MYKDVNKSLEKANAVFFNEYVSILITYRGCKQSVAQSLTLYILFKGNVDLSRHANATAVFEVAVNNRAHKKPQR